MEDKETPYDQMINYILPEWLVKFQIAAGDYDDAFKELGLKGQYSDMHRKFAKLKRALWEGVILRRETPEQICMDFIGHCLITIWLLRNTEEGKKISGTDFGAPLVDWTQGTLGTAMEDIRAGDMVEIDGANGLLRRSKNG